MTNEELVLAYQNGDKSALDQLIEQNEKIVHKLAWKFYIGKTNAIEQDDLIQEGYIGLMKAAKKYDFNNVQKAKFITYAIYWIYKMMNEFIEQTSTNNEISLQTPINEEGVQLGETVQYQENHLEFVEKSLYHEQMREQLEDIMIKELTLMERSIIKLNFGWDSEYITLGNIAKLYGCHFNVIQTNKKRALDKIRRTSWARREKIRREYDRW